MMTEKVCGRLLVAMVALVALGAPARADEGMWLFTNPPRQLLEKKYGFSATPEWLEHVQRSSVRFNSGGSGSFVSAGGLVMTNHHVGADELQKMSDEKHNYLRDGFLARTQAEEKKCVDLEFNVLMSIEDVTAKVNAAVKPDLSAEDAFKARRAVIAQIEKESFEQTKLRSDVITLYQGGEYHLYRFKRYTDIRLVFAPEQQIAFFGGDPDNFEYPRYDLDICMFRVYENDKPVQLEHYLKWSKAGAAKDELVFVSGHPGRTSRLDTVARLEYLRDRGYPYLLQRLYRWEVLMSSFSARNEENARQAKDFLFSVQNSRKARDGGLAGLLDPAIMQKKVAAEKQLRAQVASDSKLAEISGAWDKIAAAQKITRENLVPYTALERGAGFNSTLFDIARTLIRNAAEQAKPNSERLPAFRDWGRPSLELQLFSDEPLYDNFERAKLADSLTWLNEQLGHDRPLVRKVMAGKSPGARAEELVRGTKLKDIAERKKLYQLGEKELLESKDPMIQLAFLVEPEARAVRTIMETGVEEVERQAYAQIAKAKFALEGSSTYPDATFTLRLAFGTVKGYVENGKPVHFETTIAGLFSRSAEHQDKPPFDLPPRWKERKDRLDLATPFNFVCTADIIGGNSGSPVINRNAEVVGLIFDGNIQSLVLDFIYTDQQARALAVHSRGIIESLRKVYDANELADEMTGAGK